MRLALEVTVSTWEEKVSLESKIMPKSRTCATLQGDSVECVGGQDRRFFQSEGNNITLGRIQFQLPSTGPVDKGIDVGLKSSSIVLAANQVVQLKIVGIHYTLGTDVDRNVSGKTNEK